MILVALTRECLAALLQQTLPQSLQTPLYDIYRLAVLPCSLVNEQIPICVNLKIQTLGIRAMCFNGAVQIPALFSVVIRPVSICLKQPIRSHTSTILPIRNLRVEIDTIWLTNLLARTFQFNAFIVWCFICIRRNPQEIFCRHTYAGISLHNRRNKAEAVKLSEFLKQLHSDTFIVCSQLIEQFLCCSAATQGGVNCGQRKIQNIELLLVGDNT